LTNKDYYIKYCETFTPRLFSLPKWLDIVSPNWQVFKGNTNTGLEFYLPYVIEKKWGLELIRNIPLCAYNNCLFDSTIAVEEDINEILLTIQQFAKQYLLFEMDFSHDNALNDNQFTKLKIRGARII
jgi:hypothetical protein